MARTVFKSDELAHIWAHGGSAYGRAAGASMSFNGGKFMSYSTVIARRLTHPKTGEVFFVINTSRYSNTTNKHLSIVHSAIPHGATVFSCESSQRYSGSPVFDTGRAPNMKELAGHLYDYQINLAKEYLNKSVKARQNKAHYVSWAANSYDEANRISEFFGLSKKEFDTNDPAKIKWGKRYRIPYAYIDSMRTDAEAAAKQAAVTYAAEIEAKKKADAAAKKLRDQQIAEQKLRDKDQLDKWLAGENVSFPYSYSHDFTYLRIDPSEPARIQTSKGARILVETARKLWPFLLKHKGSNWHKNGERFKLDIYELDKINKYGIVAGCHQIAWCELERMAKVLELI